MFSAHYGRSFVLSERANEAGSVPDRPCLQSQPANNSAVLNSSDSKISFACVAQFAKDLTTGRFVVTKKRTVGFCFKGCGGDVVEARFVG